jgi:DNA-binding beta-propeller fold protein YncE
MKTAVRRIHRTTALFSSSSFGRARPRPGWRRVARTFEVVLVASAVVAAVALAGGSAAQAAGTITYLSQFGSPGSGPGQFGSPAGVAFDSATGNMYVADVTNDVVEEFGSSGNYISEFGGPGSGNGQFNEPSAIAVDPGTGDIYVLDYVAASNSWRIQKFDTSGNFLLSWDTSFVQVGSIAVDPVTGGVYVTDYYGNRVVKYDASGNFLLTWGWGVTDGAGQLEKCADSCQPGIQGKSNGEFSNPTTIAIGPGQDVYVADTTGRVQKFDASGNYLSQFGSYGNGDGQFGNSTPEIFSATGIAVDPGTGDVYAVDGGNNRVELFHSSGKFFLAFGWGVADGAAQFETCTSSCQPGIRGSGNGQFYLPGGAVIDPTTGNLYVVDGNYRVEVFGSGQNKASVYISSSASPSVSGQSVTYTATVSPVPGGGTVAFSDNGQPIAACGSQPVNSSTGHATCTVSYPGSGSHQIVASLSGSNSQVLSQTVNPDATTTQVTSSANPDNPQLTGLGGHACRFACPVTFTAAVSANAPGAGTPTGTVEFTIDGRDYGSATLTDGVATSRPVVFAVSGGFTRIGGSHTVTAVYSGDSNFSPSSGHLSELVTTGSYFALGDSYSAGAGVPPYLPPSDTDGCDRSALAWPYIVNTDLGFSRFSFHACTGSVVQDLIRTNPQTQEPRQEQGLGADTQLVTLTWGGNNANFADVMRTCIFNAACQVIWQNVVNGMISRMGNPKDSISLAKLYERIASDAPNAMVIVMGYPRFFPQNPPLVCYTGLTLAGVPFFFYQPQMIWIDSEIQSMDNTIANAVTQAHIDGYKNVRYVGESYGAFTGHEMCTADPYYNMVVLQYSQYPSFHPNQSGNAQLAQLAEQAYQAP